MSYDLGFGSQYIESASVKSKENENEEENKKKKVKRKTNFFIHSNAQDISAI